MTVPNCPILVVSYNDDTRAAISATLEGIGVRAIACATFCEAENSALQGSYNGMLVDLPSIIKSKGEEKIVAYTLSSFFPTLRVRAVGSFLVPMVMAGSAKQDKNLEDFLSTTCPAFTPRKLRAFRRHPVCLSTLFQYRGHEYRGFTLNLSWGGAFIVDLRAEMFCIGDTIDIRIHEPGVDIQADIRWIMPWGKRCAPGIGVCFRGLDGSLEALFADTLKSRKEFDRDRLVL